MFKKINALMGGGRKCPFFKKNKVPLLAFNTLPFFKSRMNPAFYIHLTFFNTAFQVNFDLQRSILVNLTFFIIFYFNSKHHGAQ